MLQKRRHGIELHLTNMMKKKRENEHSNLFNIELFPVFNSMFAFGESEAFQM